MVKACDINREVLKMRDSLFEEDHTFNYSFFDKETQSFFKAKNVLEEKPFLITSTSENSSLIVIGLNWRNSIHAHLTEPTMNEWLDANPIIRSEITHLFLHKIMNESALINMRFWLEDQNKQLLKNRQPDIEYFAYQAVKHAKL